MQCVIPGQNIRVFAASVQCLAKVGKELVLEAESGCLTLSAMNDARTSFCKFVFFEPFFERFMLFRANAKSSSKEENSIAIKVSLKALVSALKSTRTTERLTLGLGKEGSRHVFVLSSQCKGGLAKTYEIFYEETGVVHAQFDRKNAKYSVSARTSLLQRAVQHIAGAEEAAIVAEPNAGLRIKSHYQHENHSTEYSTLKTDILIHEDDLDTFQTKSGEVCEIAFSLREVKAILQFCENADVLHARLMFNEAGAPFLFTSDDPANAIYDEIATQGTNREGPINTFRAELIIATLECEEVRVDDPDEVSQHSSQQTSSHHAQHTEKQDEQSAEDSATNETQEENSQESSDMPYAQHRSSSHAINNKRRKLYV